jgi:hypothetical protein
MGMWSGREVLFCELKDEARTRDCVRSGNSICLCSIRWAESPARGAGSELCTALYAKLCITQSALLYLTWISFTSRPVRMISSLKHNQQAKKCRSLPKLFTCFRQIENVSRVHIIFYLEIQVDEPDFPHFNISRYFLDSLMPFTALRKVFSLKWWEVTGIWRKYTVRRSFNDLNILPRSMRLAKSRNLRWPRLVARRREMPALWLYALKELIWNIYL